MIYLNMLLQKTRLLLKLKVDVALEVAAVGESAAAAYKVAGKAALKVYAAADGTSMVVMFEPTLVVLALAGERLFCSWPASDPKE